MHLRSWYYTVNYSLVANFSSWTGATFFTPWNKKKFHWFWGKKFPCLTGRFGLDPRVSRVISDQLKLPRRSFLTPMRKHKLSRKPQHGTAITSAPCTQDQWQIAQMTPRNGTLWVDLGFALDQPAKNICFVTMWKIYYSICIWLKS